MRVTKDFSGGNSGRGPKRIGNHRSVGKRGSVRTKTLIRLHVVGRYVIYSSVRDVSNVRCPSAVQASKNT